MLRAVQEEVSDHQQLAKSLVQDNANLKQMIEMNKMTLSILDELREMGLGLRELKRLDSDLNALVTVLRLKDSLRFWKKIMTQHWVSKQKSKSRGGN
jgi:predicted acetyltransferase